MTRASVSAIASGSTRTWFVERVVVEPFEHRDEHERRDGRVEVGGRNLADAPDDDTGELREQVGAEAAEFAASDLGFRPGPDDGAVLSVQLDELGDPLLEPGASGRPGPQRSERFGQRLHVLGDLGREGTKQLLLVGEVEVERAVRGLRELDDVVDPSRVIALGREDGRAGVEEASFRVPSPSA